MLVVLSFAFFANAQILEETDEQPVSYSDNFISAIYVPTPIKLYNPPSWVLSSCIETGKYILGKQGEKWGNARDLEPVKELLPAPGVIGITNEGDGHVFIIKSVYNGILSVLEGNYIPGRLSTRSLDIDDPKIKGFWQP